MSSYQSHSFKLSPAQIKKLAKCDKIRIKYENLSGSYPVHLTQTQLKKVKKSMELKKGMDLQLTSKQVKHNVKHGGSIWSSIKDFGENTFNRVIKPVGQKLLEDRILPQLQKKVEDVADKGLKKVGLGMKKKKPRVKLGKGFFSDLWNGVTSVAEKVAPIALPIATSVITKRLGGKVARKKKVVGSSITLPGGALKKGRSIRLPGEQRY